MTTLLRWLGRLITLALVLVIGTIGFVGFIPAGSTMVAQYVAGMISKPGQTISIGSVSGLLSGHLTVDQIVLVDRKGKAVVARDLVVDWSPLALLSARFDADSIHLASLTFDHVPDLPPADPGTSETPFSLPVTIDVASIRIDNLGLDPSIAGKPFDLSVSGRVSASNESMAGQVAISDEARPGATIKADVAFDPGANQLKLDADLNEPKGGLVAGLLKLKDNPAVALRLSGTGPLSDWKGRLSAALDGKIVLSVDAAHQGKAGEHRLIVGGDADIAGLLPPVVGNYVTGKTRLELDATLTSEGKISLARANLQSASVNLAAKGEFDPAGMSDLSASLTPVGASIRASMPLGTDIAEAEITLAKITLFGPADNLAVDATVRLKRLASAQGTLGDIEVVAKSPGLDIRRRTGNVDLGLVVATADLSDPAIADLVAGPIRLDVPVNLETGQVRIGKATIESGTIGGTVSATLALADNHVISDLKLFMLGDALPAPWNEKLAGRIALSGHVDARPSGDLTVTGLSISHDKVTLAGSASLAAGKIKTNLTGRLADLSVVLADAKGAVDFTLVADGALDGPAVNVTLDMPSAELAGRPVSNLHLAAKGIASLAAPSGTIEASGTIDKQEIRIAGQVEAQEGRILIPDLAINIGKNNITGSLNLTSAFLPDGEIRFDLPDIGLIAALAGQSASGNLSGLARVTNADGKIALDLTAKGQGIEASGLTLTMPDIALTSTDLLAGAINGTIRIGELASGANRLKSIVASFNRVGDATDIAIDAGYDGKPLIVRAKVANVAEGLRITLDKASASPKGIALALAGPTEIDVSQGQAKLDNLTIKAGKGQVIVSGLAGTALDLAIRIDGLPLALANAVSPGLGAEGSLSGTLAVKGQAANPQVSYDVSMTGVSAAEIRKAGLAAFSIKAKGSLANQSVRLDLTAQNAAGLNLKGGGNLSLALGGPLSLKFSGGLPLAMVAPMVAAQGLSLSGDAKLDIAIGGRLPLPAISGSVTTANARLLDVRRNLAINDITAAIDLAPATVTIKSLKGTLSTGGKLTAKGSVGIKPGSGFPANIEVALKDVTYVQGDLATANMAGDLVLKGSLLNAPELTGKIRIKKASITIPEKMPASLAAIDVQHKNARKAVTVQAEQMKPKMVAKTDSRFAFNLEINAPAQIFVRGRGLDAELGGSLTLSGDISSPVVSGGFKMKRGRLSILGKRLDFTSGSVSFGGGLVPVLDLVATSAVNATTIQVGVSGPADDPSIRFSSSPALPEDEVLAQLIFGRSATALSAFQIAQLADAVAQLAGGRKTSLFESLRRGLGVDDLDVTTDDTGNTTVKAGKYINKRTYVEVEKGQLPGSSKATINLDIGKGVKLQGSAASDGTGAAGIFYEKEY